MKFLIARWIPIFIWIAIVAACSCLFIMGIVTEYHGLIMFLVLDVVSIAVGLATLEDNINFVRVCRFGDPRGKLARLLSSYRVAQSLGLREHVNYLVRLVGWPESEYWFKLLQYELSNMNPMYVGPNDSYQARKANVDQFIEKWRLSV